LCDTELALREKAGGGKYPGELDNTIRNNSDFLC